MASINLSGVLRDPLGEVSYGNKVRFTHLTTTGETLKGFRSQKTIVINGAYDIDLEYGNVVIETFDNLNRRWIGYDPITINSDTPANSLPALLGITTPATDADLLVFQALVADAESARDDAETAQAETESLFDNFTDTVATELADISPGNIDWDVEISFNDSAEMEKGYGTRNTHGNKAVDFSRVSATGNINKSGVVETLAADEPAITSNGLSAYESYTNEFLYSEDFSNEYWSKENTTATTDGTLAPDGVSSAYLIEATTNGAFRSIRLVSGPHMTGETWCTSVFAKAGSVSEFKMLVNNAGTGNATAAFDLDSGTATNEANCDGVGIKNVGEGWFFCYALVTKSADAGQIKIAHFSSADAAIGDSIYIWGAQTIETSFAAPYVPTTGTSVTRAADIASIPMMGNMPAAGKAFTVVVDGSMKLTGFNNWLLNGSVPLCISLRDGGSNSNIQFSTNGLNVSATSPASVYTKRSRFVGVFDGATAYLYIDGELIGSDTGTLSGYSIGDSSTISLGKWSSGSQFLNSEMKNVKIYHGALTAVQVAALGGAE